MLAWEDRPIEIANLLNPAFCGAILQRTIRAYNQEEGAGFPYALAFLVLPIVVHAETRLSISTRQRPILLAWLHLHPEAKIAFAERVQSLLPVTNETLTFLLQVMGATLDEQGSLFAKAVEGKQIKTIYEDEKVKDYFDKASYVGRWFARAGTVSTIFAAWGVRP